MSLRALRVRREFVPGDIVIQGAEVPEEATPTCEDPNHDHAHERGATTIEYGLLITLIGAVVALALGPFGPAIASLYGDALVAF